MRTLYHQYLFPSCRKVRIVLGEKKLDFSLEFEKIWTPREEFLALNPAGWVPVLVDLNDTIVAHNYAICEYLEEAYPDPPLFGDDIHQRAETRRLIGWFDNKFEEEVSRKIVYEKVFQRYFHRLQPNAQTIREGLSAIHSHLSYISWLLERRHWLAGDNFSLADITAAAQFSVIDFLGDVPWEKYPEVKDWYARIKSRPSFRPLLDDVMPGLKPPEHYKDLDF